jgi:hypothetical protein
VADLEGTFVTDSGVTALEGHLHVPAGIDAGFLNGVAINNTPSDEGQILSTVDGSNAAWSTFVVAAGVPAGAPASGKLPIAFDSTAVTGGLYIWTGAAWTKVSTIP